MSTEAKRQLFIRIKDSEIGKPLYDFEAREMREEKISETTSEFIQIDVDENDCGIAWLVDTRRAGEYVHPTNGLVFNIMGIKVSWRIIGNPEDCQTELDWAGPW
jgi:hypothetical protein